MKSLIDFPEEVVTPTFSSALEQKSYQTMEKAMNFQNCVCVDSDTDQTMSSTISDSLSDDSESDSVGSVSDCDETDDTTKHYTQRTIKSDTAGKITRQRRSVSFGPIHVRQYERIVGDHPETKVGVPLSIGWTYYEDDNYPNGVSIERYESDRIRKGKIRMSSITRKNMLLNVFGLPEKEILIAEKRSQKLRRKRERASTQSQGTLKTIGTIMRKGGISFLKGMSLVAQTGMVGGGTGFSAGVEHAF